MSKFKLYCGGQLYKINGFIVRDNVEPEQDVLSYTYEDGTYTMSISNPSHTTLKLLQQGKLALGVSVRDIQNASRWTGYSIGGRDEETWEPIRDENGDIIIYENVRSLYHSRYAIPRNLAGSGVYIDNLDSFTFYDGDIATPRGIYCLFRLSRDTHEDVDPIESITTKYKFVLLDGLSGRVYKSYSKTDGYHPITFYNEI